MTENPLPESVVLGSELPQKTGELSTQEKLEWAISSRLIQLSFKRPDIIAPISDLLRLINSKMADKLESNKYKENKNERFNLEKFEKSTARKLAAFAVYTNSGRYKNTEALELTQNIVAKLDPEKAQAIETLKGFIGEFKFPEPKSSELE